MKNWSEYIKGEREARMMSVAQAASKSGFTKKCIYNWEQGKKTPNIVDFDHYLQKMFMQKLSPLELYGDK